MNRTDLQQLSGLRRRDAKVLLDAGNYPGSYYMLGYALECAIKAAIAKNVKKGDFPDKKTVNDSHVHDLTQLLRVAGLLNKLQADMKLSPALTLNWATVKDWSETTRYEVQRAELEARDFYTACVARNSGMLTWLKKYW